MARRIAGAGSRWQRRWIGLLALVPFFAAEIGLPVRFDLQGGTSFLSFCPGSGKARGNMIERPPRGRGVGLDNWHSTAAIRAACIVSADRPAEINLSHPHSDGAALDRGWAFLGWRLACGFVRWRRLGAAAGGPLGNRNGNTAARSCSVCWPAGRHSGPMG